jgi:predicted O-methyltransferase YrrM
MTDLTPHELGGYTRADDPGEPRIEKPRISISDTEAGILATYAVNRLVLEIGTGLGVSTRALASTADEVLTYDIDEWVQRTIWPELEVLPNVRGVTDLALVDWIGLAFIDADHSTSAVRADIQTVTPKVFSGSGLIIAHDANYPAVKDALIAEWEDEWVHIPTEHGLGVHVKR